VSDQDLVTLIFTFILGYVFRFTRAFTYSTGIRWNTTAFAMVRATEQATVDPNFTRVVAPTIWCDELERIDVSSIARLQRMMCNHGMEVIGDTSPPLHSVMGVNRSSDEPTLQFKSEFGTQKKWNRRVVLDAEDEEWEAQFFTPSAHVVTPEAGVDTGLSVNFSHTPPELSVFAELPQAKAIQAAGRLACRQMDVNLDPAPFLDQFERWWGMPNNMIVDALHKTTLPISVPRLLAAGGKSASPVYGIENFSGYVRFVEPSATRANFVTDDDRRRSNEIAVDFSYYRAACRWMMCTALQIPGRAKDEMVAYRGIVGVNINLRGRVVVPEKAMDFNIPTLSIEPLKTSTYIIKQTKKAIENAMNGRTAIIAGVVLNEGELLLSQATRDRMGKIREGTKYKREEIHDVKLPQHRSEIWHAQAGVGLHDYCVNMLGANQEHLQRSSHLMGRLMALVDAHELNQSRDHCTYIAMLWDATFKNSFQRICIANASTMDDFVANAPQDYPYDARIAYIVMKSRIRPIIRRLKILEGLFASSQTNTTSREPLVKDVRRVITAWASFYDGKAKTEKKLSRKVRSQVLSAFYANSIIQGDEISFPELKGFMEEIIYNYTRRRKDELGKPLEHIPYEAATTVDDLVAMADGELHPEYRFTTLLQALRNASYWTIMDLLSKQDNMAKEDEVEENKLEGEDIAAEELDELALLEAQFNMDEYDVKEEFKFSNLTGPKALKAKFYAICLMGGSEKDFIHRVLHLPFKDFDDWFKHDPTASIDGFDDLCEKYTGMIDQFVDEEEGEADIL